MKSISKRLDAHFAVCTAAAAAVVAGSADGAIRLFEYGPPGVGIQVPANGDGLYFNLVTGVTGTSAASVGGGPFMNPYGTSLSSMAWYATTAGGSWRGINIGGYSNEVSDIGVGFVVGASVPNTGPINTPRFNTSGGASYADGLLGDFSLNALNYFGFRFTFNSATHYGYGVMRMGATITERYMIGFAIEDTAGASITTAVIPAPGAAALLVTAGALGFRRRRA